MEVLEVFDCKRFKAIDLWGRVGEADYILFCGLWAAGEPYEGG